MPLTGSRYYQEFMSMNLTDKYTSLSTAMDKLINEANSEIQILQGKIGGFAGASMYLAHSS